MITTEDICFTIPLAPVTKKNSGRIVMAGGKYPRLLPSKAYEEYERACGLYIPCRGAMISEPIEVTCLFYMQTRRRVDLANLLNAIDDVLVKYGVVEDDNSRIIVSHDGSRVLYDKTSPRTEVVIRGV